MLVLPKGRLESELHRVGNLFCQRDLEKHGYLNVTDVSGTQSCDFWASFGGEHKYIEVKGTTSSFGTILLTANEVELHREFHPDNILIVIHDIELVETGTEARGGHLVAFDAWDIAATQLKALSYSCTLAKPD